jgi:5-methyltetrahydropteroyltriglutamate--homocysteine methyltransferase
MQRITTTTLGVPRMGRRRELKNALEDHWKGAAPPGTLEGVARTLRRRHWIEQMEAGIDLVPSNDFSLYDHVLDVSCLVGNIPPRFGWHGGPVGTDLRFSVARGTKEAPASEMTKWFDTNYHHIVPEFGPETRFRLSDTKPFDEFSEAMAMGIRTKPVLLGPVTYLSLCKVRGPGGPDPFDRLEDLLSVYAEVLSRLAALGARWVQLDEPILSLDLDERRKRALHLSYAALSQAGGPSILVANYFGRLAENLPVLAELPVDGAHVDLVEAPEELPAILERLPRERILSLGLVDGRNIWKTDLERTEALVAQARNSRSAESLWIAPSCSLLHAPASLEGEDWISPSVRGHIAFAHEKLQEIVHLASFVRLGPKRAPHIGRFPKCDGAISEQVRERELALTDSDFKRSEPFERREVAQNARLGLPPFPTTTIGSFPQTQEVRATRAAWKAGRTCREEYEAFIDKEMARSIALQEDIGLDLLVHGEFERNDMVEHFAEHLDGYAFTANGWVQSYGSRCVKPPIIFGDVSRREPMTLRWADRAKRSTSRPVKGMLTGPVTMMQWSFVRVDLPRRDVSLQIALALRDEVSDLQELGVPAIQIDEPALREALPLRRIDQAGYLDWAVDAFRLASGSAAPETQIHTHMCYSEFSDILPAIVAMDADVITIEAARSGMDILDQFVGAPYPAGIGPGVWDIHSPRIPSVEEILSNLEKALHRIPARHLWVNPDCGLKTRGWKETVDSLRNMVAAARRLRESSTPAVERNDLP